MDRRAGLRNRARHSSSEDEKISQDQENGDIQEDEDNEDNDYVNEASSSGPGKTLEDDIKYFLNRVSYIGETNPGTILYFILIAY